MSTETRHCPKCGGPISPEAPQGLCPRCLLAGAAMATETGAAASTGKGAPEIGELAAAFPQLEIIELIGQGGMGFVYKARQPKLDRFVALKILPRSLAASPAFAERFTREGRVLARLNHPNIVTIHDFGEAGGYFYLLMEFVDGVNLRQAMRAGRFTAEQALAIVPKICEALQFAHNEGVLHRDIKPENIMLDSRGRVKIADFGIAKLVGEGAAIVPAGEMPAGAAGRGAALTETGRVLGTPQYMAPEQVEHPGQADHRADIYSLGVVFYEMLTGELPLGRFAPPSQKSAADPRLDEVVMKTLEKEPERRTQTAGEVRTQVETIAGAPRGKVPEGPAASKPTDSEKLLRLKAGVFLFTAICSSVSAVICLENGRVLPGMFFAIGMVGFLIAAIRHWPGPGRRAEGNKEGQTKSEGGQSLRSSVPVDQKAGTGGGGWKIAAVVVAGLLLVVTLLVIVLNVQAPRLMDEAVVVSSPIDTPDGRLTASGFTIGRMRILGSDRYNYRFMVQDSTGKVLRQTELPVPFDNDKLRTDPSSIGGPLPDYYFGTHGRIEWQRDGSAVTFSMRGVELMQMQVDRFRVADRLTFGPVVERVVPFGSCIDFQTGKVMASADMEKAGDQGAFRDWFKQRGLDASAEEKPIELVWPADGSGFPRMVALFGESSVFVHHPADEFESVRAEDLEARLKVTREQHLSWSYAHGSGVWWFQTADGAKGVLEILGSNNSPRGLRIRYKLSQARNSGGTIASVRFDGQKATITARLGESRELLVFVGEERVGWRVQQPNPAVPVTETVEASDRIRLEDGSYGKGFVFRSAKSTTYVAITPAGPVPFGELVFRDNPAIAETNGVFTFADIRQADGRMVPVSACVRDAQTATEPIFGPVMERVVEQGTLGAGSGQLSNCWINLKTGELFSLTVEDNRTPFVELEARFRQQGVDVACVPGAHGPVLKSFDQQLRFVYLPELEESEIAPGDVPRLWNRRTPKDSTEDLGEVRFPQNYLFKRRDGSFVFLQLTGLSENSTGLKLRRKLVQEPWQPIPPEAAELLDALNKFNDEPPTDPEGQARFKAEYLRREEAIAKLLRGTVAEPLMQEQEERLKAINEQEYKNAGHPNSISTVEYEEGGKRLQDMILSARRQNQNTLTNVNQATKQVNSALQPGGSAVPRMEFGPVVERVIQARQTGTNAFLDLDAGELLTPPPGITSGLVPTHSAAEVEQFWRGLDILPNTAPARYLAWLKESGTDLMNDDKGRVIAFEGTWVVAHGTNSAAWDNWEGLTPEMVRTAVGVVEQAAAKATSGTTIVGTHTSARRLHSRYDGPAVNELTRDQSTLWYFKTREGGLGILQVIDLSDTPSSVRIRYKLVNSDHRASTTPKNQN